MPTNVRDVQIKQVLGHWEVYINEELFCTTDSYVEAVNELYEAYK